MRQFNLEESVQSFADLIFNLLAILIVFTLVLLLLTSSADTEIEFIVDSPAERDRTFPMARLGGVPKFAKDIIVYADGIAFVERQALMDALVNTDREKSGSFHGLPEPWDPVQYNVLRPTVITGSSQSLRQLTSDPGEYLIEVKYPDAPEGLEPRPITDAIALIDTEILANDVVPHFLVSPAGFDYFTQIERELVANGTCFRWSFLSNGRINLRRDVQYFRKFAAQRCTW